MSGSLALVLLNGWLMLDFRFSFLCRTGSLSSEDDEDWPTSPVVPVYEELS